ncbi:MAG: methyltransferase domain-containing protein [Candidatus Binatia bacterium]
MQQGDYVIRGGAAGRERLRILARVVLPTTRRLFERVGVGPGMACLDVGCGGGDASVELARLVGPRGRVIGIDMDAAQLELARAEAAALELDNIEFRVSQIGAGGDEQAFDVVYARFVLTHLPDAAAALAWMLGRVRPGGLAIVEDIDFRGHFCEPDHPSFRRFVDLYTQVVRGRGADPDIGPRLPGLLLDVGAEHVGMHVVQPAGIDGEVKLIAALTMENIADAVLTAGAASRAEIDALVRDLFSLARDGRTAMSLPRMVQAWGRRAIAAA